MGTTMAVNFANISMSRFERSVLGDFKRQYESGPNTFITFCKDYARNNNYHSEIKFTVQYSKSHVEFLDTR